MKLFISIHDEHVGVVEAAVDVDARTVVVLQLRGNRGRTPPAARVAGHVWLQRLDEDFFVAVIFAGPTPVGPSVIIRDGRAAADEAEDNGEFSCRVRFLLWLLWDGDQHRMARWLDVSQGLISKVINGHHKTSRRLVEALVRIIGVERHWLETGADVPPGEET